MKKIIFFLLLGLVIKQESFSQIDSAYFVDKMLSPLDSIKPCRVKTVALVLHTMEGTFHYGLKGMIDSALCNFAISYSGSIVNIVDKDKMSNGAGRSMFNGDTSISNITINIEFEGFSSIPPTPGQTSPAIARFLYDLQIEYGIPDSMVLIHPVVACFYPTMRHTPHPGYYARGRKSDAFYFADDLYRLKLGLDPMMKYDKDVWEGRVIQNVKQAKRMGMYIFSDEEIFKRKVYLQHQADSIELAQVQPIDIIVLSQVAISPSVVSIQNYMKSKKEFEKAPLNHLGKGILRKRMIIKKIAQAQ